MIQLLHKYRFEVFLVSQIAILFGSLLVPTDLFDMLSPILFYLNIVSGSVFIGNHKKGSLKVLALVLIIIGGVFTMASIYTENNVYTYTKIAVLFLFHLVVTYNIISQIWRAKVVNKNLILGVISGFISLGLIGFFFCLSIEIITPNSFSGIVVVGDLENSITERLMYYSYITLMTIGYGDILPLTLLAQKATIVIGLIGQFYLVIITAIVVGKFVNQNQAETVNKEK